MSYIKQNFKKGSVLEAEHLNHIEDGIIALETALGSEVEINLTDAERQVGGLTGDGVWHKNNGANCIVIDISKYTNRTISLTKGENDLVYSFLIDLNDMKLSASPVYASGYNVPIVTSASVEVLIPNDAVYLYLYANSATVVYIPDSAVILAASNAGGSGASTSVNEIRKIQRGLAPNDIKLCTWNIGHFANGGQSSTITSSNYDTKLAQFKELIYTTVDPDILCLQEYSAVFGSNSEGKQQAKDVLFHDFATQVEGTQVRYGCNAVYANACLENIRPYYFECNKTATTHTSAVQATDFYTFEADLYIRGRLIKFVSVHLAFNLNLDPDTVCENQMRELIERYAEYDRVIFCGDWNAKSFTSFNVLTEGGYSLLNTDSSLVTMPNGAQSKALDNVAYRGVNISDMEVIVSPLSDHYPMICKISL